MLPALRIALIYLALAALWIALSDRVADTLAPDHAHYVLVQTWKGWFFVAITAVLLFLLVQATIGKLRHETEEQRHLSNALAVTRSIQAEILESLDDAVWMVDLRTQEYLFMNAAVENIYGVSPQFFMQNRQYWLDCVLDEDRPVAEGKRELLKKQGFADIEYRIVRPDDGVRWIQDRCRILKDEAGRPARLIGIATDISAQRRNVERIHQLSNYDTLTGLPNRALLSERLGRAIVRARRQETRVAVLFLDLDRFKDINDSLGHAAGDRLLKAAATRLQATVGASDTVARLGGDEFTVVLEDVDSIPAVERMARDILTAFSMPLEVDERHDVSITPSLGISLYPDHALVPTDLLKFADTAMYQAKAEGRNTYQIYNETMDAESRRRATVLASLRKALDRGEFRLVYQPRMALADGRITGVESLLRWHSAELGEINPTVFIPLAEESGLILQIGDYVLSEALQTLKRWRSHGLNEISIGINVSVLQLLRGNLPMTLRSLIHDLGVPANRIELEVTESMVMQNAEQTTHVLNELRKLGVTLAIDDFGTGYSSLVYLKRLPIDTLKIDKEFIGDLTRDPDDEAITATVITMGHSLGLNVIAEGVESEQQLSYLREQGCDEIQGFWLSPPLDAHRCLAFIRSWQPATVAAIPAPY